MAVPSEMLLHPELLTNEQLVYIMLERQLRIPNIQGMPREDLLQVFHQYCVPYGQRKYRDSGRGKILNKSRNLSPESKTKLNTMQVSQKSSKTHFNNCERLKPPPDILSGHMKRIKLEHKATTFNKLDPVKRKMSIDELPVTESPTPQKKERKLITWP